MTREEIFHSAAMLLKTSAVPCAPINVNLRRGGKGRTAKDCCNDLTVLKCDF